MRPRFSVYELHVPGKSPLPPEVRHGAVVLVDEHGHVYAAAELCGTPAHVAALAEADGEVVLREAGHPYIRTSWLREHPGDALDETLAVLEVLEADGLAILAVPKVKH